MTHGAYHARCSFQHLPAPPLPHAPPDSRFRTFGILFSLWLMVFTAASQTIIITPILPVIGEALSVPVAQLGQLVSVYSILLAAAALVMGPISDRIGRRKVLLLGSGTLGVVLALHGLADSFGTLLAVRMLAGAAGGMLSGAAVSYVGDYFPYARRGWATGWVMSGVPFGLVLGIPLGRILAVAYGFRAPFVIFAGVMAVAFVLILLVVPQPDVERQARLSLSGALRRYASFLTTPDLLTAALTYFLMYLGLGLLVFYLPQWITDTFALEVTLGGEPLTFFGLPVDFIALLFMIGGVVSVLVGPRAGTLSDTLGRKPLILASCFGLAVAAVAITYVTTERWVLIPGYILIMALFSLRMAPLQALLTALVPSAQRGAFLSLTIAVGQLGTALGAFLAGVLYAAYGYRADTFAATVFILLMAALVWRFLPEPTGDAEDLVPEPEAEVV